MSDFSVYSAGQIADWLSQGTIDAAPSTIYVALFNGSGTEVSGDFANDRPSVSAGSGWTIVSTGFENANAIDFGEASSDVNDIQEVALYDDNLTNGGNELAQYTLTDAPFDISSGSSLLFEAGDLSFDVVDRTE